VSGSSGHARPVAIVAALGAVVLPPLYAWTVRFLVRWGVRALRAGDLRPILGLYADDVRFVFPGRSSWAADLRGKEEVERWLRRFVRVGLQLEVRQVLVNGPPWNTTVCVHFVDHATGPDGQIVYANRGAILAKVAWGRVIFEESCEDTQKVAEFDEYLASHEPAPA
jgi:ketosteroid isomerase-like protein